MRLFLFGFVAAVTSTFAFDSAPLPYPDLLKQRAITNIKRSEDALERYSCTVHRQVDELNVDGRVKKREATTLNRFYVHGIQIDHVLERNGNALSGTEARKEQERVDKEVKKYGRPEAAVKSRDESERDMEMFLRAQRLTNGRREVRGGRAIAVYELTGDPAFRPKRLEERLAQVLSGRIWIDEETGIPVEVRIETTRDVKIGGGLIATLHKGFHLRLLEQRQPDGAWITQSVEGSGDARAALFFHPRFRFREDLENCKLFSVDSRDVLHGSGPDEHDQLRPEP